MRVDGTVTYYFIQHLTEDGEWCETSLDYFLFHGDPPSAIWAWREQLMAPQSANSELWQEFGIHGYVKALDAQHVHEELRLCAMGTRFRVMKRTITQETVQVGGQ